MRLVNLVIGILYGFAIISDANAMCFNMPNNSINPQYANMSLNKIMYGLGKDVQCLKEDMKDEIIDFYQIIQSLESKIFAQTSELRQHFWQIELLVDEQVAKQVNAEREEWNLRTYWKEYFEIVDNEQESKRFDADPLFYLYSNIGHTKELFCKKIANPLFYLRIDVEESRNLFHSKVYKLTECICKLNRIVALLKEMSIMREDRLYSKYGVELRDKVRQLNMVVDEYFYGSLNHIRRLESVIEEQTVESQRDANSLKVKIDESFAKLRQSLASQSDLQQSYEYQKILSEYVRNIDNMTYLKDMSEIRRRINKFRKILCEDVSSLYQSATLLQSNICGEFSYQCNKFPRYKPREGSKLKISSCFYDTNCEK